MSFNQTSYNYSVSWSDFTQKASRPPGANEDAQIHTEMSFSNFQLKRAAGAVGVKDVDIKIHLVSGDCWVVTPQMTNDLLRHEQGHYDIIAISARELYNGLLKLNAPNTSSLQKKVTDLKEKQVKLVTAADKRYDKETNHSRNTQKQQQWNNAIVTEKQKPDGSVSNLP